VGTSAHTKIGSASAGGRGCGWQEISTVSVLTWLMQACERMLEFILPAGEYSVIDTAWALSTVNRRSYRQGFEYAFDKLEIFQTNPLEEAIVDVCRLPHTWVCTNAWVKAYHNWKAQQDDALEDSDTWSARAAYRDFKICYNHGHATGSMNGQTVTINPSLVGVISLPAAQVIDPNAMQSWEYSEFVVPNLTGLVGVTEEYIGYMLGPDAVPGKGLIQAYAESRARPHPRDPSVVTEAHPDTPPGGLYAEMQDVGEDLVEVLDNVRYQNDEPPYVIAGSNSEFEFYPGGGSDTGMFGVCMDTLVVRASSFLSTDAMGSFTAPCGLIWLHNDGEANTTVRLWCSPGPYQGVMARSMLEAN